MRLGGDEFLLLIREADAERAAMLAARIRDGAAEELPCALSVGSAVRSSSEAFRQTLARADMALYADRASSRGAR